MSCINPVFSLLFGLTRGENHKYANIYFSGCSQVFADAVALFTAASRGTRCHKGTPTERAAYPEKFLYYTTGKNGRKENYCDSDVLVQALTGNDAVKLRAYFYAVDSCNQYYTGYGWVLSISFFSFPPRMGVQITMHYMLLLTHSFVQENLHTHTQTQPPKSSQLYRQRVRSPPRNRVLDQQFCLCEG